MLDVLTWIVVAPWLWDVGVRLSLAHAARKWSPPLSENQRVRWLVLVPARNEGAGVVATLQSVMAAIGDANVKVVLLLDGDDPIAERAAARLGVGTMTKRPAGPTKGAILNWAVNHLVSDFEMADAVFLLDVGSVLPQNFFDQFLWPVGASAVQAFLAGRGSGVARAAAFSERTAQLWHDRGREALGWTVHLRGTGTAFTTEAFRDIAPRLMTSIEDTEATLLLASEGARTVLGPEELAVGDDKPEAIRLAARQRSRWLAGQVGIIVRRAGALGRLIRRRPFEGLAFGAELLSRPLSLTGGLRLFAGLGWTVAAAATGWSTGRSVLAAILLASVAAEVVSIRELGGTSWRDSMFSFLSLGVAWVGALTLLPRTIGRWMSGRERR